MKTLSLLAVNLFVCTFCVIFAPTGTTPPQGAAPFQEPTPQPPDCQVDQKVPAIPVAGCGSEPFPGIPVRLDLTEPQFAEGDATAGELPLASSAESVHELRQQRVATVLQVYFTRQVDVEVLRPWSIMHGLIAYGRNSQVVVRGEHVNAADYLCQNGIGNEMRIMYLEKGRLMTRIGVGVQGHPGQLLAILAQSNIPLDHRLSVDGKEFTVKDLVEYEKRDCRSGTELTFKLIGLSHYCEPGEVWRNEAGEKWSFPRLIREELAEPVSEGACGGTHRLMALSFAVFQVEKRDLPLAGEWLNAARKLDGYVDRAYSLQNPDGSFSTEFFEKPGAENERIRRCYTTGHIVEWLAFTLPANKMSDPRLTKAVDYLTELMLSTPNYELDVGPRGHALHALAMYELKAYGKSSQHDHYLVTGQALPPTIESKLVFDAPTTKPTTVAKPASWTNDPPRLLQGRRRR